MKFIVDAQLPNSLSKFLNESGFDSIHTLDLPGKNSTDDIDITALSIREDRIVITKDNDFLDTYILKQEPKKLIIVRTGNIKNNELKQIFEIHILRIIALLQENSLIEISRTEIVVHN